MTQAIAISPNDFRDLLRHREINRPPTANSSRLWDIAQKANALAVEVEGRWEELPEYQRKLLTTFAYAGIEPPQGIKGQFLSFIGGLSTIWNISWIVFNGDLESLFFYAEAYQRLINAIFDGIERENEDYQSILAAALEEAFTNLENTQAMTGEEASE
jgi:hypothetical protein